MSVNLMRPSSAHLNAPITRQQQLIVLAVCFNPLSSFLLFFPFLSYPTPPY
jgi:hypothetical protein